jgi:hypothetical protein
MCWRSPVGQPECRTDDGSVVGAAIEAVRKRPGKSRIALMINQTGNDDMGVGESVFKSLLPEVYQVAAEVAEARIDALIDSEALDAIPVVKSVRALARGVAGFRETWLEKKLMAMMYGFGPISADDAERWTKRPRTDKEDAEIGERVIALVDRVTARVKAQLIGKVMRAWLDGRCDRPTFLRTAEMIDDALTEDLSFLIEGRADGSDEAATRRLVAVGLMVDRSSAILDETSLPPAPSDEGTLLRGLRT